MSQKTHLQARDVLKGSQLYFWRAIQYVTFLIGTFIFLALIFYPTLGIHDFWNILIPLAPLLLVLVPGLWRNICPLSFISILPHRLKISRKKRLKVASQGKFMLAGVILLYLILPLRHIMLDTSGPATAAVLFLLGIIAFWVGVKYEWKSGWCSGLCPVHPVEKLYGSTPKASFPNAQCTTCKNCVIPCPDSSPNTHPLVQLKTPSHRLAGILLLGGFPGFIWGWFHVPDYYGLEGLAQIAMAYGLPLLGMTVTLSIFHLLYQNISQKHTLALFRVFAMAAVVCYYGYRLPALIGFGMFPGDGMLVDLSQWLPEYISYILQGTTLFFFSWCLLWKRNVAVSWKIKPPFDSRKA